MIVPNVLIAGAFGQGNPGDESILDALLRGLDGCAVSATSANPFRGPTSPPCRLLAADNPRAVAAAALEADLVVATATVFKSLHPSSRRHPLALLADTLALGVATRLRGRPVAMVGVGAAQLESRSARVFARAIAGVSGPITMRDEESASILRAAGVQRPLPVAADVTWSLMPEFALEPPGVPAGSPKVVVALSHLAGDGRLVASIRDALRELHRAGCSVTVQPWQLPQDAGMAAAVAQSVDAPVEVRDPPPDVVAAASALRGASVVLGLRFHSLVAAAAAGVPFVAIAHEPKLAALARRLEQTSQPPSVSSAGLAAACREAAAGAPPSKAAVRRETQLADRAIAGVRALAFERARNRRPGLSVVSVTST
ncbi:MAG TPA: polysaccharide pyruvyl transferase family protein [Acidimicrobiales bacterium]|nr:polysaccharide pyruvyl transferase family protein [Acidimicrobiales bacterium]